MHHATCAYLLQKYTAGIDGHNVFLILPKGTVRFHGSGANLHWAVKDGVAGLTLLCPLQTGYLTGVLFAFPELSSAC